MKNISDSVLERKACAFDTIEELTQEDYQQACEVPWDLKNYNALASGVKEDLKEIGIQRTKVSNEEVFKPSIKKTKGF